MDFPLGLTWAIPCVVQNILTLFLHCELQAQCVAMMPGAKGYAAIGIAYSRSLYCPWKGCSPPPPPTHMLSSQPLTFCCIHVHFIYLWAQLRAFLPVFTHHLVRFHLPPGQPQLWLGWPVFTHHLVRYHLPPDQPQLWLGWPSAADSVARSVQTLTIIYKTR